MLKLVVGDLSGGDAEGGEHFLARFDHHGRAAEVELDRFRGGMIFKIPGGDDFVDEAGFPFPMVFGERP